ncbi:hypothetical protein SCHPADRAFT_55761 [Schizopora paradoxa]|uniref:Mid2 domain-containing protein n=1 Tax=Schizopora paradoxa TaxID=27342 RepID=A0A0H2SRJ8_9AGAM|nr:hypothetical protein SCHPADRAFT_55761 [Schizopora paradoxa]
MARHLAPADGTNSCGPFGLDCIVSSALSTLGLTTHQDQFTSTSPTSNNPTQTPTSTSETPNSPTIITLSSDSPIQSDSPSPTSTQSTLSASSATQPTTPLSSFVPIETFVTDSLTDLGQATSTTVNIILESTVITGTSSLATTTRIQTQPPASNSRKNATLPGVLGVIGAVALFVPFMLILWRRRRKSSSLSHGNPITPFISANNCGRNAKLRSFFANVISKQSPVGCQSAETISGSLVVQIEPPTYSEALEQPASPAHLLSRTSGDFECSKSNLGSPVTYRSSLARSPRDNL